MLYFTTSIHNKFISKNKVHVLVPWHPFSLNIIFIEFRMSGIKEYNLSGRFNSYVFKEGRQDGRQAGKKFSNNSGTYQNCLSNNSGAY